MNMLKPVLVLSLICMITAGLLAGTYSMTKDTIKAANIKATNEAMAEVLPGATAFTEVTGEKVDAMIKQTKETKVGLLSAAKENSNLGYTFKVQDKGFGGAYVVMVGISTDGQVTGVKLLDNQETPGLGSKSGKSPFIDQFAGKDKNLEGVETITGATVSSLAFIRCVNTAFEAFEMLGEGV